MNPIEIYAKGLVCCSVCASKGLSKGQIEEMVNEENPTGIDSEWKISKDKEFTSGEPMPSQCEHFPDRIHYLLNC